MTSLYKKEKIINNDIDFNVINKSNLAVMLGTITVFLTSIYLMVIP